MTSLNLWQGAFFVLGEILVNLFFLPMFAFLVSFVVQKLSFLADQPFVKMRGDHWLAFS